MPDFAYAVGHAEVEQLVGRLGRRARRTARWPFCARSPAWPRTARRGWPGPWPAAPACWRPRRTRRRSSCISTTSSAPSTWPVGDRLDGTYNVSPDGWIAGRRLRALAGAKPRVRPPAWFTHWISNLRWRFQRGPIPPGLLPYMTNALAGRQRPLKAEGWQPRVTNEQAYVAGTETRWWQLLTPKRRQELALALAGLLAASVLVTAALLVRGAVRRNGPRRRPTAWAPLRRSEAGGGARRRPRSSRRPGPA